ncbi:hypothetical protein KBY27_19435 [Ruegeria pomeroyi]|uniref:PepSY domain-containing protein n=1 Tax=Ruegeria pomeroyi TaxID=89184 RepID=A0A9Q3ZNX9_9RHOB|nr:hypothetical protein [Ruegeria pomeroyi]MCE8539638.1 hypothetical protein [Ruegeria pomeroyi]
MDRRSFITSGLALMCWGGALWAQTTTDTITRQLRAQGYTSVEVSRTLLGRARIVARRPGEQREIIVNPRTGEILRDYWQGNRVSTGGGLLDRSPDTETETEADDGGGRGRGRGRGRGGEDSSSDSGSDGDDGGDDGGDNSGHGGGDDGGSGSGGDGDD